MTDKMRVAIIGSGNIGTDLMYKLRRSALLEPVWMVGIDPQSEGLARARRLGLETSDKGIEPLLAHRDEFDVAFEATTAKAHIRHAKLLRQAGKIAIDLTPAALGPPVVPVVNLDQHLDQANVNLLTCGAQATVPIVAAIKRAASVEYAEIVSTIASKSAGPGTRQNIDEFTRTTARGLESIGGARKGKAIIILNPAEPPIIMRNTVFCLVDPDQFDAEAIARSISDTVAQVQSYVPGYHLRTEPLFEGRQVTVFLEVEGAGDFLPTYSGNLDIMTAAAVKVGEEIAKFIRGQRTPPLAAPAASAERRKPE